MLIVKQSGDAVVNLNTIEFIFASEIGSVEIYPLDTNCAPHIAGNYETQEKAKSVLREIWSAYANGEKVFLMP